MKIVRNISVPTGNILVVEGHKGLLECLSLGDYGKDVNIKADFMGLDRELKSVSHTKLLPLEEKWVVTISTQYGCSIGRNGGGCKFCDVPNVKFSGNATFQDLIGQVKAGISLHPEVTHTDRLNVHYARMGEPTFNQNVIDSTLYLAGFLKEKGWGFHPVVSTMMPYNNPNLKGFIRDWMRIKGDILKGEAGLQLSINSTNEDERWSMFNGNTLSLNYISDMVGDVLNYHPIVGRKITLNFAVAGYEIDASKLARLFNPSQYIVKLTPMHKTVNALENGIETEGDYTTYHPYEQHEKELKEAGFDVLTFIASKEEDDSTITCGNAIIGGSKIKCEYTEG